MALNVDLLNLTKEESLQVLDLRKDVLKVNLEKSPLSGHKARVAVVLDYSGSMSGLYDNGSVQAIVERLFPIALEFDNDGAMDVWIFENGFRRLPQMTMDNYYGYIQNQIIKKGYRMGGTNYAPVMKDVGEFYLSEDPQSIPNYVIFITDGDNFDKSEATAVIKDLSNYPIFWQFVGIGSTDFPYLEKLDDMGGRYVDNADFFCVSNTADFYSNDAVYQLLLNEYPNYLAEPKVTDMIANNYTKAAKKKLFGLF